MFTSHAAIHADHQRRRKLQDSGTSLRTELVEAKRARNSAQVANAERQNAGLEPACTDEAMTQFRRHVHEAAARCRDAEVDISDLVAPNVGMGAFEP
jgi:multidrug resistance efflux pump